MPVSPASTTESNFELRFSGDSKTLIFGSSVPANTFVAGVTDTNNERDAFAYDIATGKTTLVSVNAAGTGTGNKGAIAQSVSGDGSRVTLHSFATDLDPTPVQNTITGNVFLRDRAAATTTMISTSPDRKVSGGNRSAVSRDGQFVMFQGTGLLTANFGGVFRYEVSGGKLEQVNVQPNGAVSKGQSVTTSTQVNVVAPRGLSADGRYVTFVSSATDLVPGFTPTTRPGAGNLNVFVRDMTAGVTILVSHTPGSTTQAADDDSALPAISADGKLVAFYSYAADLTSQANGNDRGQPGQDVYRSVLNFPPTITAGEDVTVEVGIAIPPIAVTIADTETAAGALTLTATSNNSTLIPASGIVVGGTGGSRTVTITPAASQTGTAIITVTVTDAGGLMATDTFTVTVTPPNTPPTISDVTNQTTTGPAVGPLNFTVGDAETPAANLTVSASSSNGVLVPNGNIVLGGSGANRTVTITPVAGQTGTTTITLTVTDANGATATDSFTVTVTGQTVNILPTISDIANQSSNGAAVGPLAFTVGDAETPVANLVVTATSSNPTLIPNGTITLGGSGANRTLTVTPVAGQFGSATITVTVTDANGGSASDTFTVVVTVATANPNAFAVGSDAGGTGAVTMYNPTASANFTVTPFPGRPGGVRVASGDVNGDGVADLIVGTGPGGPTHVRVFDGVTKAELVAIEPFEASFTGGVFVAAGDLTGDGKAELVITPDQGGGPRARVFTYDGTAVVPIADFFGILGDPNFRGGARAAVGDVTGDGVGDLIVAAGFGGGPRVAVFDGAKVSRDGRASGQGDALWDSWKPFGDLAVFEPSLRNGVFIAAGDLTGDGFADLIVGGGPGGAPRVFGLSGQDLLAFRLTQVANFFAGDTSSRGGVRVAVTNLDDDNRADLVAGAGLGAGSRVTAYTGAGIRPDGTPTERFAFDAFDEVSAGVFVG